MKALKALLVVMIVGLVLVACGEGKSDPTEAGLNERAEAAAVAASSANQKDHPFDIWNDVYGYLTPEYQDRCGPDSEYGLQVHFNLTDLAGDAVLAGNVALDGAVVSRGESPAGGLIQVKNGTAFNGTVLTEYVTQLNYQVTGVTVDGDKGQVELAVTNQGELVTIAGDQRPEYWVYEDGQWFLESSAYWMDSMERDGQGCQYGNIPGIPIFE